MVTRRHDSEGHGVPWATPEKVARARELRRNGTPTEERLWRRLRGGALGVKVRRQHTIAGLIVDFYVSVALLVIELDGEVHEGRAGEDAERTRALETLGLRVLRFRNEAVEQDEDGVVRAIVAACSERSCP